jgi:hypothetical protein
MRVSLGQVVRWAGALIRPVNSGSGLGVASDVTVNMMGPALVGPAVPICFDPEESYPLVSDVSLPRSGGQEF